MYYKTPFSALSLTTPGGVLISRLTYCGMQPTMCPVSSPFATRMDLHPAFAMKKGKSVPLTNVRR